MAGAVTVAKQAADADDNGDISFTLADAAAHRTAGASRAIPEDARHWDAYLLEIFKEAF